MALDIGKAKAVAKREDEGLLVTLEDESGQPTEAKVRIAGSFSERYRQITSAQTQRLLKRKLKSFSPEEIDQNRTELVAGCILGWEGLEQDGQPWPFTKANAQELARVPHLREQLEEAQQDHAGFSRTPSAS